MFTALTSLFGISAAAKRHSIMDDFQNMAQGIVHSADDVNTLRGELTRIVKKLFENERQLLDKKTVNALLDTAITTPNSTAKNAVTRTLVQNRDALTLVQISAYAIASRWNDLDALVRAPLEDGIEIKNRAGILKIANLLLERHPRMPGLQRQLVVRSVRNLARDQNLPLPVRLAAVDALGADIGSASVLKKLVYDEQLGPQALRRWVAMENGVTATDKFIELHRLVNDRLAYGPNLLIEAVKLLSVTYDIYQNQARQTIQSAINNLEPEMAEAILKAAGKKMDGLHERREPPLLPQPAVA